MTARKADSRQKQQKKATASASSKKLAKRVSSTEEDQGFPIVGLGASAGGLEAIEGFFAHARHDGNMAFVIIQHLAPGHKSIMDSLLKKYTEMKVLQVKDGVKIEPNCVYLNQPDKDVVIMNRTLYLTGPTEVRGARLPIDHFFRSLADDQGERAVCIILSGTGTDGTLGLKAIKGAGGMSMVQDEEQARYDSMPRNAIDTGLVDYVLPVEKMFDELRKYVQHPYIGGDKAPTAKERSANYIGKILMLIRSQTGHDFSHYKQNTIRRRIERRMAVHQIGKISDYVSYLQESTVEVDTLFKDMLITVTNFFRDPEAFDVLARKVIPNILEQKTVDSSVRVWITGCATGEEAYSIAMLIAESAAKLNVHSNVQVFATDIDRDAIEYARQGIYPDSISADVAPARLTRFFVKEDSAYRVKKQIREMVVFATQNLIKDAPFSKLDLVCCRNVLIYMDAVLQKKILPLFRYTLNPGGYLFLGTSETIGDSSDRFTVIDAKWKIFKRKSGSLEKGVEHPIMPLYDKPAETRRAETDRVPSRTGIRDLAERTILQSYAPPCVLINDRHEILYFHGNTERFLTPPAGEATFDILKMVRDDLRYKLSTALHRAAKERKTVVAKGLQVKQNGGFIPVDIVVRPVAETAGEDGLMMVIFESNEAPARRAAKKKKKSVEDIDSRVRALEQELQSAKEYLQTTIEELETSNEELKSTNEELQSTNEELQSTNEELETSREELQSTNEELETVNSELMDKVDQLSNTNDDLNNLLSSTQIGTVFLDMDLRVKRFTSSVNRVFNLIETDVGRPISDITSKLDYPHLLEDARETLGTLIPKDTTLQAHDGAWFSVRVLPYRTVENVIDGIVITFVDVTEINEAAQLKRLATVLKDSNDAVTVQDLDGRITAWNKGAEKLYGYTEAEALKMNVAGLVPEEKKKEALDLFRQIKAGKPVESARTKRLTRDGRVLDVWLTVTKLEDKHGRVNAVATTERNLTDLPEA
jgi:two-component system CheB/CheR fusion protein